MDGNSVTLPRNATIFRDAVLYRILQSINMAISAGITLGSGQETRIYSMLNDSTIPLSIGKLSSKSVQPWKSHQETKLFQKVSTKIITNKKKTHLDLNQRVPPNFHGGNNSLFICISKDLPSGKQT